MVRRLPSPLLALLASALVAACTAPQVTTPVVAPVAAARPVSAQAPALLPVPTCRLAAGPAPLRRLTRDQYVNSVTDLLELGDRGGAGELRGNSVVAGTTLPADESVGPFRSNVVAATTPLDVQQLMEAAERIADRAAARAPALLGCDAEGARPDAEMCGAEFVARFGRRAFRRPLRPEEQTRYARLFAAALPEGRGAAGVRAVVRALLQSPYFLMHTWQDGAATEGAIALGPYALASRLSYFLWASPPDDELLEAAALGLLATPDGLRAQARRMLQDDRARRGLNAFHLQWLGVEDVASLGKSKLFPAWKPSVGGSVMGAALRRETERFVDQVIRHGDGRFATLMTAPRSYLEEPLFDLYGVATPEVPDLARATPLDPRERAGLLTQGSVLAAHAHAAQSSPVARGVLIRKSLLCQDLPDPPPNVNNTPPEPDRHLTTRARFDEHRESGVCSRCHALIDPLGFAFERYDAIGRFRATENGQPVDATGSFVDAGDLTGNFDGAIELARRLAASRTVRSCYVRQWFRYAVGRRETPEDACSLATLEATFDNAGGDVRALLLALPTTDAFRYRGADAAKAGMPSTTTSMR